MSTTIKFFNSSDKLITEQQVNLLSAFSKHLYIDDVLKIEEIYRNYELWGGVYYSSPAESLTDIFTKLNSKLKWSIRSNKQIINGYLVWESRYYFENLQQKSKYSKIVIDNTGNEIATISYDSITNKPLGAFKVFNYGNKPIPWGEPGELFPEDSEIYFSFSDDGNIKSIRMHYDIINNESYWTSLNKFLADADYFLQEMEITPEQLYYYTHVEPLVPNF